jgi:hypothetical protein
LSVITPVRVKLSPTNVELSARVGLLRFRMSGNAGLNPHQSQEGRTDEHRIWHETLGCMAEAAVAQHIGIAYAGTVNTFHAEPDVGPFEVRATDRRNGCLIVRDNDPPERPYVLVVGNGRDPVVELRGWLFGHEARDRRWLRNPHGRRPCWMVPQHALRQVPVRSSV